MNKIIFLLTGLLFFSCAPNHQNNEQLIKVAVFEGNGAGSISVVETIEALKIDNGIYAEPISAAEIQSGKLEQFDAFIFPGGSGSKQLNNLGQTGKEKIIEFVKEKGKGIVGICAGAYLLSSTKGYPNIKLASSVHLDRKHYNRGRGLVEFALTGEGLKIFPELKSKKSFVQYYDGPVLAQSDSAKGEYTELAKFVTDIHPDNYAPAGITPGKTFWLNEEVGNGKIFITAGHPESTPGMRWMVPRMVRWVTNSELVDYDPHFVKAENYSKAILYDKQLKKYEKDEWWKLFHNNEDTVVAAMNNLNAITSRPAVRWNIGLLRHSSPKVRLSAAKLLYKAEYSAAKDDVKSAYEQETDAEVKEAMKLFIEKYLEPENHE